MHDPSLAARPRSATARLRRRIAQCALRAVSVLPLLAPSAGWGWDYHEHVQITEAAFAAACDDLRARGVAVGAWCETNKPRVCLGHMVAIAGDHAARPAQLIDMPASDDAFLHGDGLDCRDIAAWPSQTAGPFAGTLVKNRLAGWLAYGKLAASNVSHFQPEALREWRRLFDSHVLGRDRSQETTASTVAHAAFALHYLQDAFSAGHNGLRREALRQDYGQAYHDDISLHGIFLRSDQAEWYAYGDDGLDRDTVYVPIDAFDGLSSQAVIDRLEASFDVDLRSDDTQRDLVAEARDSPQGLSVLSAPPRASAARAPGVLGALCQLADACPKVQIVLYRQGRLDPAGRGRACQPPAPNAAMPAWRCQDSRAFVVAATRLAIELLLRELAGHDRSTMPATLADLESRLPRAYRTIETRSGDGPINAKPMTIWPTALLSHDDRPRQLRFRDWTYSVDCLSATASEHRNCRLWFGLYEGHMPDLAEDAYFGLKWQVIDSNRRIANAVDIAGYWTLHRFYRNIFGFGLKVSGGAERLWDGSRRRASLGLGLSMDFHKGKHNFFVDYDRLRYYGAGGADTPDHRVVFGVKWAVINLFQSARD